MARKKRRQTTRAGGSVSAGGAAAVAAPPPKSLWILDVWKDLLLFVATPVLILPLFLLAAQRWSFQEIALFVAAFGALGHHFPGMLRAYGDRELFRRFKTRFVLAPLFLASVSVLFSFRNLSGMVLIAALWGIWHGMAQTYGFLRIYDAKKGSFGKLTTRLDFLMCIAWFGAGLVLSPTRLYDILGRFYLKIGGPILPQGIFPVLRSLWWWGTLGVTVAFVLHTVDRWSKGQPPSPIKLLLMATSFGFWWYSSITVQNVLVGVALFEIFHDVQYLSIVWIFNRGRAEKGPGAGAFTRFLFRKSGALVGVYVGLVFAYGSLAYVARGLPIEPVKDALTGILVASAILHFYYDGFIWKMRDKSIRQPLGIEGGESEVRKVRFRLPAWAPHGLKWVLFVVPVAWLGVLEARYAAAGPRTELERPQALAAAVPNSSTAHLDLGKVLAELGQPRQAVAELERALALRPDYAEAHYNLSLAWADLGDLEQEVHHLEETLRIDPDYREAHNNLAVALTQRRDLDGAAYHCREAIRIDPGDSRAHYNLGLVLAARGEPGAAAEEVRKALEIEPDSQDFRESLRRIEAMPARRSLGK